MIDKKEKKFTEADLLAVYFLGMSVEKQCLIDPNYLSAVTINMNLKEYSKIISPLAKEQCEIADSTFSKLKEKVQGFVGKVKSINN